MLFGCFLDVFVYIFFFLVDYYFLLLFVIICFGLGSCLFGMNVKVCLFVIVGNEYVEKICL